MSKEIVLRLKDEPTKQTDAPSGNAYLMQLYEEFQARMRLQDQTRALAREIQAAMATPPSKRIKPGFQQIY